MWGRGRGTGIELETELNLVYTVVEGKIAGIEGYLTRDEALEAAGQSEVGNVAGASSWSVRPRCIPARQPPLDPPADARLLVHLRNTCQLADERAEGLQRGQHHQSPAH